MRVRNARAALLSDYEVLQNMQDLEKKRIAEATAVTRMNSADDKLTEGDVTYADQYNGMDRQDDMITDATVPRNLRSIQYALLETLNNVQRPSAHQSEVHLNAFLDAILAWERGREVVEIAQRRSTKPIDKEKRLTKGEKLMLVNHAPASQVALFAIIEELGERFSQEEQDDLLDIIFLTLPLDQDAIDQIKAMEASSANPNYYENNDVQFDEAIGEDVYVGREEEEEAIVDDLDELENEGRDEGAVDDDPKEDD